MVDKAVVKESEQLQGGIDSGALTVEMAEKQRRWKEGGHGLEIREAEVCRRSM